jgi:predicted ribonuclease YlaK
VIEQNHAMWQGSTDDVARKLWKDLTEQMTVLKGLYSESALPTFVPDTNALIYNPALDEWDFPREDGTVFELILTPTVLSELDTLKEGRPDATRTEKAQRVIRQIKEYGNRGDLLKGVVLRKDRSIVSSIAVEPDMKRTLSWLVADVNDDRFLASMLEIVKRRPNAPVTAVTGDVNVQNKFRMAGLPFVEPPEPSAL